jgi:hypothetical protein
MRIGSNLGLPRLWERYRSSDKNTAFLSRVFFCFYCQSLMRFRYI